MRYLIPLLVGVVGLCPQASRSGSSAEAESVLVRAKKSPSDTWKEYPTRTLEALEGFAPGTARPALSRYGGRQDRRLEASGFVRVAKVGGRDWLVDPEGCLLLHIGVCSVNPSESANSLATMRKKWGTREQWAAATTTMLREHGFNGTGSWADLDSLNRAPDRLLYTCKWSFMGDFGRLKKLTFSQPGHQGYIGDCMPVFHADFEAFCEQKAKALLATRDDPWLVGHFSDNELPAPLDLLDKHLKLDRGNPDLAAGYEAAQEWLRERQGKEEPELAAITDQDRDDFRGYVFERYFAVTTQAIRKADPNHLCLGPRLYGASLSSPAIFAAAGKYLDVIACNYYGVWTPNPKTLANWKHWSGRPVLISEWYTKGEDSGMPNSSGAGWIVPTQEDRGRFYQNYTLALLESRVCVGWHWFKYMDNDPTNPKAEASNTNSNKGIVNIRFEPYTPLLERMRALNREVYAVVDWFDARAAR